jgi:glycosyltransferase involved in cell wall biosynthesis
MASGKPVIACRGQGIEEIIQSGKNGLLVEPGGVEQLAHALRGLLETPSLCAQIGAAARQTMLHGFTLADQAQQLVAVYEDCVR